jgi:hypothetical protein
MWNWLWTHLFRNSVGILGTFLFFAITEVALLGLSFGVGATSQDHFLNCTMVFTGVPVGWIIAVVLTPDTREQRGRFERGGAALSAVLTGYLIGKGEDSIKRLLDPGVLFRPLVGFRSLALLASLLAAFIVVFVHREYRNTSSS